MRERGLSDLFAIKRRADWCLRRAGGQCLRRPLSAAEFHSQRKDLSAISAAVRQNNGAIIENIKI